MFIYSNSGSRCMVKRMWNLLNLWCLSEMIFMWSEPKHIDFILLTVFCYLAPTSVWACASSILSLAMSLSSFASPQFSSLLIHHLYLYSCRYQVMCLPSLKAFETFYCAIVTITSIQHRYAGNSFCIGKENLSVSADGPLIFKMITNFCIIMYCVSVPYLPITLIYRNSGKFISQNVKLIRLGSNVHVPFIFLSFHDWQDS